MKQRIGLCTNFGNCSAADSKRKVPITGGDDTCPLCGSQLTEFRPPAPTWPKVVGLTVFAALLVSGLITLWQWLPQSLPASMRLLEIADKKPADISEAQCLLDLPASDTILSETAQLTLLEMQRMLPMTRVAAVNKQPIPRDLHVWMKQVDVVTAPAFFIQRREVTVGEFKRYVATRSPEVRIHLGQDWQQDRNGMSLPEDYPVSTLSWQAANDYAQWLSQETHCTLTLPTYAQWLSAVVQYAQPDQTVTRRHQQAHYLRPLQRPEIPEQVVDLLGNLREWVLDTSINDDFTCSDNGHLILGEDYKTWLQDIGGKPLCETMALDTIGFRLVRLSASP